MTSLRTTLYATIAAVVVALELIVPDRALAQAGTQASVRPRLRVGATTAAVRVDGRLDDPAWARVDSVELVQVEPREGAPPSARTVVRVLATSDAIVIGIRADDPDGDHLMSFSRQRDAPLSSEDHVKIVLDSYGDGRSGYVFAVNPDGARYDALVTDEGQSENANWDTVWVRKGAVWEHAGATLRSQS